MGHDPIPDELVKVINSRKSVLFVGAGLSVGAGLPTWIQLLQEMLEKAKNKIDEERYEQIKKMIENGKLLSVAEHLRDALGKADYARFMKEKFSPPYEKKAETYSLIARLPFHAILTTNYDKLIETSYETEPPVYTHNQFEELSLSLGEDKFYVLKCHGDINDIETIILTEDDYLKYAGIVINRESPILTEDDYKRMNNISMSAYHEHIKILYATKTIVFIGLSLRDPDIQLQRVFPGYTSPNYALMKRDAMDLLEAEEYYQRENLEIIFFDNFSELTELLQILVDSAPSIETEPE